MQNYKLDIDDVCSIVVVYKNISHKLFSYIYKKSKNLDVKRLSAKISSDEYELFTKYYRFLDKIYPIQKLERKNLILSFYPLLLEEVDIPITADKWDKLSKNIKSCEEIFNLFTQYSNSFSNYFKKLFNLSSDNETKKYINTFFTKEKEYIKQLNDIFNNLNN